MKSLNRLLRLNNRGGLFALVLIVLFSYYPSVRSESPDSDISTLKQRILAPLLSSVDTGTASNYIASLSSDGSWADIAYKDSTRSGWKVSEHLSRLSVMTRAYRSETSPIKGDAAAKKAVHLALGYWLERDFQNSNWWWNVIGVPRSLGPVLLMLEDELTPFERSKGIEILTRGKLGMTGQNLVWVALITLNRGILEHNPETIRAAVTSIADEIRISEGEGIQADYSFYQHGDLLYNHGYGSGFALDCSTIATVLTGTSFAFPQEKIDLLTRLILDGHQWMMRYDMADYGARGREIVRQGTNGRYMAQVAENMLKLPTGRDAEFAALRDRTASPDGPPLIGNRHFPRSDIMTHQRAAYYTSARMYSTRVFNTDGPANDEGIISHHVADGCNYLFVTGREYYDIFPVWDWQKIPGTTVVQTPELSGDLRRKGETSFAGGVSDGMYGAAAFDFVRYDLKARKAWFFFDSEYLCLGAGISCGASYPVVTTVNQCLLDGDVTVVTSSGKSVLPRGDHSPLRASCVSHGGIAYIFPGGADVAIKNDVNTGSWHLISLSQSDDTVKRDVFTLTLDHGVKPDGARYAYIVAPGLLGDELESYSAHPPVEIISNEPNCQAVHHTGLKITSAALYEPGTVQAGVYTFSTDRACMLLVREQGDSSLAVTVSCPDHSTGRVNVTVRSAKNGASAAVGFDLPEGLNAGGSVTKMVVVR